MGIGNGMRGIGLAGIGLLAGCGQSTPTALGTLEWDRITVPAPAAEVIATVEVREGQQVKAGAVLMQLDPARETRSSPQLRLMRRVRRPSWKNCRSAHARSRSRRPRRNWPRCAHRLPKQLPITDVSSRWHGSA